MSEDPICNISGLEAGLLVSSRHRRISRMRSLPALISTLQPFVSSIAAPTASLTSSAVMLIPLRMIIRYLWRTLYQIRTVFLLAREASMSSYIQTKSYESINCKWSRLNPEDADLLDAFG